MALKDWSTNAPDNDQPPDGFAEGMAPSLVNDRAREVMKSVRVWYEDAEWINHGHDVNKTSATTFSAADGDHTGIYTAGRRVKMEGDTTEYATITDSAPTGPDTVITVFTDDGGSVPDNLSDASVGILNAQNTSLPQPSTDDGVAGTQMVIFPNTTVHTLNITVDDAWTTIDNSTLADAGAKAALIRVRANVEATSANASISTISVFFRQTGSGIGTAVQNNAVVAVARMDDGDTNSSWGEAVGDFWVALDDNQDFDYFVSLVDPTAGAAFSRAAFLVGYMR